MQKIVTLLILFILSSCEGFIFQEQDNDYIIIDSEQEKIDLLNGIYARLTEVHNGSYLIVMSRSDDINVYINYSFMYPDQTGLSGCMASSGSGDPGYASIASRIYKNLYLAILNANNLIGQLDEEDDRPLLGETYFLRAYCYFKLARLFGKVPLVTDIDVNYLLKKPTYREVYELIGADLQQALDLLPETYSNARIPGETPHIGTAKALLAEVYLAMAGFPVNDDSKYAESARLAGEVIQAADYYGYALLDDMGNLWKKEYRHNAENIFGLFFLGGTEETNNYFGGNYLDSYTDYHFKIGGYYHPDFRFFNEFPNNYRKLVSVVTGEYEGISYDTLGGIERSVVFRTYDPLYNACYYIGGAVLLKWINVGQLTRADQRNFEDRDLTLYLLRYAQTLLTYAEAKTRAGELDESCYQAINMVRRRANKIDIYTPSEFDLQEGLSAEQFLDSLVWERAWELFGEPEGRWFDIVRLDLKDEIAAYRYPIDLPNVVPVNQLNEDWYFFLIPADDRWLNPNFTEEDE